MTDAEQNNLPADQKILTEDDVRDIINSYLPSFNRNGVFSLNGKPVTAAILIQAKSGTTTNTSAENVDTVSITDLKATDRIVVKYMCSTLVAGVHAPVLYSNTDAVTLNGIHNGGQDIGNGVTGGQSVGGEGTIQQEQQSNVVINSFESDVLSTTGAGSSSAGTTAGRSTTVTTPWTSNWTLAFHHGGVFAGATFRWSWQVYKVIS